MAELEYLNHRVVERLKYLDMVNAQQVMMALSIGTQVSFDSSRHRRVFGTVFKLNRKTRPRAHRRGTAMECLATPAYADQGRDAETMLCLRKRPHEGIK